MSLVIEPATSGKLFLKTSVGDIEVELWAKETPKTCRNFIQLCLEGYYDNTIFHRVVKGFKAQGGDPNADGTGGESIYGATFKDEFHQRLKFNRRGLLAMANGGSKFFFTLGATPELQDKHTIFGKITEETVFNILMLEEGLIRDERPVYPHKIIKIQVLNNPFSDIDPRVKEKVVKEKKTKKKRTGAKNFKLLSFVEEAEKNEEEHAKESENVAGKSKSTCDKPAILFDLSDDEKPSSAPIEERRRVQTDRCDDDDDVEEDNTGDEDVGDAEEIYTATQLEIIQKELQKGKNKKKKSHQAAIEAGATTYESVIEEGRLGNKKGAYFVFTDVNLPLKMDSLPPKKFNKNKENEDVDRHPFYSQFDIETAKVLQMLVDKKKIVSTIDKVLQARKTFQLLHANSEDGGEYGVKVWDRQRYKKTRSKFHAGIRTEANLLKMASQSGHKLPCHDFVYWHQNVLVTRSIGTLDCLPQYLKHLSQTQCGSTLGVIASAMRDLYQNLEYVHGDLSPFTVLWHKGNCYFINFTNAVHKNENNADDLLRTDCENMFNFFREKGITQFRNPDEMFDYVVKPNTKKSKNKPIANTAATEKQDEQMDGSEESLDSQFDSETAKILEKIIKKEIISTVGKVILESYLYQLLHATSKDGDAYRLKIWDRQGYNQVGSKLHNAVRTEAELLKLASKSEHKLPCEEFIFRRQNVLVTRSIGAPNSLPSYLKYLKQTQCKAAASKIVDGMRDLYHHLEYIHGNLSPCNILWYNGNCYFINYMHAVHRSHITANKGLERDCENLFNIFKEKKVLIFNSSQEIFDYVIKPYTEEPQIQKSDAPT